ncbi:MAG TPA: hypothetical protein VMR21_13455 [Vicinamibacteria bacterium]|nr:hypothetical protein [Vicinamibacteria bacterium]
MALAFAGGAAAGGAAPEPPVPVAYAEVLEAIRGSTGYDRLATTNGGRLQSAVLLHLARKARARAPDGPPLLVRHDDWFRALLEATGSPPDRAPLYAVLAHRHRQDIVAEYRDGRVVREVVEGPAPRLALDVTISWPDEPGAPSRYSYEDTLSTPHVKVTNKRVITYRLLDFGDMIAFEEMEGLTGRPTTGALGLLFQLIGEGRIVEYRMAVAPGGVTVSRGRARKGLFEVATTLTVQPDGRSERGVPEDPVLRAIAERLERPMEIRFHPRR